MTLQTTSTIVPAEHRPVERSSRLSNGVIPLIVIIIVIAVVHRRRRRAAAEAARSEGPRTPSG